MQGHRQTDARSGLLLEREGELGVISRALAQSASGAGGLVAIEGAPGVGKTRLLACATERARDAGFEVLQARGSELEREFPFGAALALLRPVVERRGGARRLTGAAALARPLFDGGPSPSEAAPHSPHPLLHGLYWLTVDLADAAPLAIVVDDAHWVDDLSLRWLAYIAQRLEGVRATILLATRPGPRSEFVTRLLAHPSTAVLRPGPLTADAVERVVTDAHPTAPPAFSQACRTATGGNPLLLGELLTALAEEGLSPTAQTVPRVREIGPRAVARAMALLLGRLPPAASELARAVAVLGDGARLSRAAALAQLDLPRAARHASELTAAGIFADRAEPAFAHPIQRAALYEALGAAQRTAAHGRAAALLLADAEHPERVAAHLLLAAPAQNPAWVQTLLAAADTAGRLGAPGAAVEYLRRALREPPPPDAEAPVRRALGIAELAAGDGAAAALHLEAALAATADRGERIALALQLGQALYGAGSFERSAAAFEHGREEALTDNAVEAALELESGWASAALWSPESSSPRVRARIAAVLERSEARGPARRALLGTLAGMEMMQGEDREAAVDHALAAWDGGALLAGGGVDNPVLWSVTGALSHSDAWEASALVADAVIAAAAAQGALLAHATARYVRAAQLLLRGHIAGARADVEVALAARDDGWDTYLPAAMWVRTICLLETGDEEQAARAARFDSAAEEERWSASPVFIVLLNARAEVALAAGEAGAALDLLRDAGRRLEVMGVANPGFFGWRARAALAAARCGDGGEARRLADEDLAAARRYGAPRAVGIALRHRANLDAPQAAAEQLRAAVAVLEGSGAELEHARALIDLGAALRACAQATAAREPLRRGLDLAETCGAGATARRARGELLAAGGRPRRARITGADALTPGERRVTELAAAGLTNRQVAEALFVTVKAVEFHLANAYRKLGIRRRTELAEAIAGVAAG